MKDASEMGASKAFGIFYQGWIELGQEYKLCILHSALHSLSVHSFNRIKSNLLEQSMAGFGN